MKTKCYWFILFIPLILISCRSSFQEDKISSGKADFSRTIALGGNFMSGYQDGALTKSGQMRSIPALVFEQMQSLSTAPFVQAQMPDDLGLGLNLNSRLSSYQQKFKLVHLTDCDGNTSLFPTYDKMSSAAAGMYLQPLSPSGYTDFSIPFSSTQFFTQIPSSTQNIYFNRYNLPSHAVSVLEGMFSISPTFTLAWLGVEDIYNYALQGASNAQMPEVNDFRNSLDSILNRLGGNGAIANIPDVDCFPFFTTIGPISLKLDKNKSDSLNLIAGGTVEFIEGDNGFLIEDISAPTGVRLMTSDEKVLLSVPLDSIKCHFMGSLALVPNQYVLDSKELKKIQERIVLFNQVIQETAEKYDWAFVNMNDYFSKIKTGIAVNGVKYNSDFIKGGFYSLDGFHPNQKGYGLIANQFIRAINTHYQASIPETLCKDCIGIRFPE